MKFDYKTLLKILLSIVLIALILYKLEVNTLVEIAKGLDMRWILLGGSIIFVTHLLMVYKLKFVFNKFHKLPTKKVFWSHFFGYLLGQITPGKLGYFSLTYLFKKDKIPYPLSSSILLFCQLSSFIAQMSLAGLCVIYLSGLIETSGVIYMTLILGWVLLVIIGTVLFLKYGTWKFGILIKKLPKGSKILNFIDGMSKDFKYIKKYFPIIFLITIISWILGGIGWWAYGMALGVDLPFFVFVLLNPLISSLTFMPLTPAGIGIAEAGNTLIFSYLGLAPEKGFIFILVDRSVNLFTSLLGLKILLSKKSPVFKK